jgi:hypothetical protein
MKLWKQVAVGAAPGRGDGTVKLYEIVRQRAPELKNVIGQVAHGPVGEGIGELEPQGQASNPSEHASSENVSRSKAQAIR